MATEEQQANHGPRNLHPGQALLSPFNELAARGDSSPPAVQMNDVTLREGEQASYAAFSWADRRRVAERLDQIGVASIQLSFAKGSDEARQEVRALVESLQNATAQVLVVGFSEDWRQQIDHALAGGIPVVRIVCRSSDILLERLGMSRSEMLERAERSVRYAVEQGATVQFSATDATRTDLEYLRTIWRAAADAGAAAISIPDTVGVATPEAMAFLVRAAREQTTLPIAVHCHNDFGMAVASTIASVRAGASITDVTVNGLGDRSGNAPLDEVVMALHLLYGIPTGVDVSRLTEISELLAEITGIPVPGSKPIVGEDAFSHKLDIHVRMAVQDPLAFQAFVPELVGNRQQITLGRLSGPHAVRAKLERLGAPEPDEETVRAILAFAEKWALERRAPLPDEALMEFVEQGRAL